jgi:hypothetical protein
VYKYQTASSEVKDLEWKESNLLIISTPLNSVNLFQNSRLLMVLRYNDASKREN